MATTITSDSQIRIAQVVAAEVDVAGVEDKGQAEAQAAMDVITAQGYVGSVPSQGS